MNCENGGCVNKCDGFIRKSDGKRFCFRCTKLEVDKSVDPDRKRALNKIFKTDENCGKVRILTEV